MRKNYSLTPEERADAREALQILRSAGWSGGSILTDSARIASGRQAGAVSCGLETAADQFVRDALKRNLRRRSVEFYESKLAGFLDAFEGRDLDSFSRPEVRQWLEALPVSDTTREGYLRAIRAFFRWAVRQEPALCRSDPTDGLALRVVRQAREVPTLGTSESEWVIANAGDYRAALALMLFAGIRPSEINAREKPPLLWRHVDFKGRSIRIEAETAKTRVARVLEGLPPNLWQWLRFDRGKPNDMICKHQTRFVSRWLMGRSDCPLGRWPQDVCRHSFATYHVALFGNVERTSLLLGHEGHARLLHQRYRGVATKAEAKKFFSISP